MRYFLSGCVPWLEVFPVDTTVGSDALQRHIVLQRHHRSLLIVLF